MQTEAMAVARAPLPEREFSTQDVLDRVPDITARQIQWWDEQGIVSPRIYGHDRKYTLRDLADVKIVASLRSKGLSLKRIRMVIRQVRRDPHSDFMIFSEYPKMLYRGDSITDALEAATKHRGPVYFLCTRNL